MKTLTDIELLTIRSDVNHRYATTTMTKRFVNRLPVNSTSVFYVPLPNAACVVNFTVYTISAYVLPQFEILLDPRLY